MPPSATNAWGALLQGFAQGRQQAEENDRKRQELELLKKRSELELKRHDIESRLKEQQLQDAFRRGKIADEMMLESQGGIPTAGAETGPRMEGGEFYSQPGEVESRRKTPTVQQRFLAEAMREGKFPAELLRQQVDPVEQLLKLNQALSGGQQQQGGAQGAGAAPATGGMPFQSPLFPHGGVPSITATGRPTVRGLPPPKEGIGVDTQLWARIMRENPGASTEQLREIYNNEIGKTAAARSAGGQTGALGVRKSPEYLQNKTDVATAGARGTEAVKAQERLVGMSGTTAIINEIEQISNRLLTSGPGLSRFVEGAKRQYGAFTQENEDAVRLDNLRNSYSNILSRSVLAEKGVLTDRDRQFATNAIPSLYDSKQVAAQKITMFKSLNSMLMDAEEKIASGRPLDIQGFRRSLQMMQGGTSKEPPAAKPSGAPVGTTKSLGGKNYRKVGPNPTDWEEVK